MKAVFLTNKNLLRSEITGGVQLCSQEFHLILQSMEEFELVDYYVPFTRRVIDRLRIRWGIENYSMYDVKADAKELVQFVRSNGVAHVFINMASAVRYARVIKEAFGDSVKVTLLSHGNHSGDFLHLITTPPKKASYITQCIKKFRLGALVSTESLFRKKYLDAVLTLSETEKQIENWFGARNAVFLPRRLWSSFLPHAPVKGRIGFVGRLDHPPNFQGLQILLDELKRTGHEGLEIRLVGAPVADGRRIAEQYPFINYLGELSDAELDKEAATWCFFLNPVWWYSTGASTKLSKGISWGIPIITTTAGMRGYEWKQGSLLVADTPLGMCQAMRESLHLEKVHYWAQQTKTVAQNGLSLHDLQQRIRNVLG
ncbi:MAG TPA: glycosyltransferase [Chitinophagaceae bacterium]|nr:glycosyltransferase [Chitinophagaceae bacterium]